MDLWTLGLSFLLLTGCGDYVLRGEVFEGRESQIRFISEDEPVVFSNRLDEVTVELVLEPQSLGRKVLATQSVAADGTFAIPVKEFGAGLLEYEFGLVVRKPGYDSAVEHFRLPARDKRVLVTLAPGPDRYRGPDDPRKEAEHFLKE